MDRSMTGRACGTNQTRPCPRDETRIQPKTCGGKLADSPRSFSTIASAAARPVRAGHGILPVLSFGVLDGSGASLRLIGSMLSFRPVTGSNGRGASPGLARRQAPIHFTVRQNGCLLARQPGRPSRITARRSSTDRKSDPRCKGRRRRRFPHSSLRILSDWRTRSGS